MGQKLIGLIAIIIIVFTVYGSEVKPVSAINFYESQITSNASVQENPDAYYKGSYGVIVWQDNRNGDWDIYMYAPSVNMWNPEIRLTVNSANQINPQVYNDTIVWQDYRNGNWDIYMYNVSSKVESQVTNSVANQMNPDIYGDRIVWQDDRTGTWAIFMYDMMTKTESRETGGPAMNPAIFGNRIAYEQTYGMYTGWWVGSTLMWDTVVHIECKDVATGQIFHVSNPSGFYPIYPQYNGIVYEGSLGSYFNPGIYANSIVYQAEYSGVYMKDFTGTTGGLISGGSSQYPAVSENQPGVYYAVYMDGRNGNWDIYLYNTIFAGTSSPLEYRVTDNAANQKYPVVMEGRIVYQDDRNGNWDIFETFVGYGAAGGGIEESYPSPGLVMSYLEDIKSLVADASQVPTSDFAGANDKVRENRRNAILNQFDSAIADIEAAANTQDLNVRRTDCQSAMDQLSGLINKVDGWSLRGSADAAGSGYTPDWITAPLYLDQTIRACVTDLQTLYDNIS